MIRGPHSQLHLGNCVHMVFGTKKGFIKICIICVEKDSLIFFTEAFPCVFGTSYS